MAVGLSRLRELSQCHQDHVGPNERRWDRKRQMNPQRAIDDSALIESRFFSQLPPLGHEPDIDLENQDCNHQHDRQSNLQAAMSRKLAASADQVNADRQHQTNHEHREEDCIQHIRSASRQKSFG